MELLRFVRQSRGAVPRRRRVMLRGAVAMMMLGGLATPVRAADVRIVTRTFGEGYMIRVPGPAGVLLSRRRLVQYVDLGVQDLLRPREATEFRRHPDDGQLRIVTSLRLRHDFGSFAQGATGRAATLVDAEDGQQVDVLFGYLEGENFGRHVDFRVGRQFEMSGLDWYAFDGGWLRMRMPGHLAVEGFAGLQVNGADALGYTAYQLDGTSGTAADRAHSPMVGAAVATHGLRWLDARVAYRRTWTPRRINPGLDGDDAEWIGDAPDQELVSAAVAMRWFDGKLAPHAAARFNFGTGRLDDVTAGISWHMTELHLLRVSYLRTLPAFDLDSIFNVFASEPIDDLRVVYEVRPNRHWSIAARVQERFFHAHATELEDTVRSTRAGHGGGIAVAHWRRKFAARLDTHGMLGVGGWRIGGSIDTRTHLIWERLGLDARVYALYYREQDDAATPPGFNVAMQLGTNVRLWQGIYFNVLAEELVSREWSHAFRLLAILSVDVSVRVGRR